MFFPKDTWSLNWWISAKRSLLDVGAVSAVHFVDVAELRHNVFADVVAAVLLFLPLHHQNQKTQATPVMVNCLRIGRRRIWSVTFISDFIFSDTFLRLIKSDLLQASVLACLDTPVNVEKSCKISGTLVFAAGIGGKYGPLHVETNSACKILPLSYSLVYCSSVVNFYLPFLTIPEMLSKFVKKKKLTLLGGKSSHLNKIFFWV